MEQEGRPYLILVGIDYSSVSELALEGAIEIAAAHPNASIHVVHVVPALDPDGTDDPVATPRSGVAPIDNQTLEMLKTYVEVSLAAFEKKLQGRPVRPIRVVSHLRSHAPAHEIAQLAVDLGADLVVVGMHGHGFLTRFFLGSVAEAVTRLAPCPVLVFRPKGVPPEYPKIEPPCPRCVEERTVSGGQEYWCEQHRERHGQRHVYYHTDRMSQDSSLPLVG